MIPREIDDLVVSSRHVYGCMSVYLYVCRYVCMYVYMCICMYDCMYIDICVCVCISVCMCVVITCNLYMNLHDY